LYAHLEVVHFMALGLGPCARGRRRQLMRRNGLGWGFVYIHSRVKIAGFSNAMLGILG